MAIEENSGKDVSKLEKRPKSHTEQKLNRYGDSRQKPNLIENVKRVNTTRQDIPAVENDKETDKKNGSVFSRRPDVVVKIKTAQSKTSPDRKSVKSLTSDCMSTCSREKKYELNQGKSKDLSSSSKETYKIVYHEGFEVVPFLVLAAQKQREIVRMLQYEKIAFRRRFMEKEKETENNGFECRKTLNDGNQFSEPRPVCHLDASYTSTLEEISCIWINLFYFILNLRVNLIKLLNKSGKESFVPNIVAERDILSRAVESVRFFSVLKMKILSEILDRHDCGDGSKKSEITILENEDSASSSFICEMEFMGSKVKEIVGRIKKVNEKRIKTR